MRTARSSRFTDRLLNAPGELILPELFPEIIEKAFTLAESGQPGPVLVNVPMDIFSKEIDVELFQRLSHNTKTLTPPSMDEETAEKIVRVLGEAKDASDLCRRRRPSGQGGG